MKNKITYLVLVVLLASFVFVGIEMGNKESSYGKVSEIIVENTKEMTGAINSVTAVVFDFRGYDTLGESIVLFTAVCGVATVLKSNKKLKKEGVEWEKEKTLS